MSDTYKMPVAVASVAGYSTQYSASYPATAAMDVSISTYWRTANNDVAGAYISLLMAAARRVTRLRWYVGSTSYRAMSWTISGSNDNVTYTPIYTGSCAATTGWQVFDFDNPMEYLYYKITCNTGASTSTLYTYELEFWSDREYVKGDGRQIAIKFTEAITSGIDACPPSSFTVTVPEYTYVPGGTLQNVVKAVERVEAHPTEANTILLTLVATQRFPSAAGDISIAYDGAGGLAGVGGPVAAFTLPFTPEGLIPKPHQNDEEHIEIDITAVGTLTRIYYTDTVPQDQGHFEIGITAMATLIHVDDT